VAATRMMASNVTAPVVTRGGNRGVLIADTFCQSGADFYISFVIELSCFFTSSVHGNGHVSGANLPSLESHYNFVKKKIDILESISVVSALAGLGPCRTPIAKFLKIFLG